METQTILISIVLYFITLMVISYLTSRKNSDNTYFTGDRKSPWFLVAFGMVGSALSGVTFVSLPGMVANNSLYFFQFVLGNMAGYLFIAFVLTPLYYKLQLVSIYGYLNTRFGGFSYKTGSLIFLISQSFGAALRLMLAAKILQFAFFDKIGIPFAATVAIILVLVWLYTNKSGIKTIVWTDSLQTFFLIVSIIFISYEIITSLNFSFSETASQIKNHPFFDVFNFDGKSGNNFFKQFISGFFIAVSMIGLDQNMMQKTLTCKNVRDAQKNTLTYSLVLALTQFLFLIFGILLYMYADKIGISLQFSKTGEVLDTDNLFPNIALNYLGIVAGTSFLLGIIAASFSSVDSALTALTTSFTYDFMNVSNKSAKVKNRIKNVVLLAFSVILFGIILSFWQSRGDVVSLIFKIAGYTYGPLLGLYMFGMFTKIKINDHFAPIICISSPIITYLLSYYANKWYHFDFGFVNIAINGCITFLGLLLIRKPEKNTIQ
ncbi:sodium:solute symporter [Capnocytophaga canimorsus]|uniref:sodium:solute symporter n=1 Tax=Capnocytophaga canimorsus TaxID=28188 RepID=UPI00385F61B9